jgi:hypothetical protein
VFGPTTHPDDRLLCPRTSFAWIQRFASQPSACNAIEMGELMPEIGA